MNERDIKIKLNQWITEIKIINRPYLLIFINGVSFFTNRIEYDDEHCLFYLDDALIGSVYFSNIKSMDIY